MVLIKKKKCGDFLGKKKPAELPEFFFGKDPIFGVDKLE